MRQGKLSNLELNELITLVKNSNKSTLVSAGLGKDCAAVEGDGVVWLSSDPITAAPCSRIGELAVIVNCNDIAASGVEPCAVLITLILPSNADFNQAKDIIAQAQAAADRCGVDIIGGHTEFSDAVIRPIISATALGFSSKRSQYVPQAGDDIILTKSAGIEGTLILLEQEGKPEQAEPLYEMLSVLGESRALKDIDALMHDVTEGGVLGAVSELEIGYGFKASIDRQRIEVSRQTINVCKRHGQDPLTLIGSGSMLVITHDKNAINLLKASGIHAAIIGKVSGIAKREDE